MPIFKHLPVRDFFLMTIFVFSCFACEDSKTSPEGVLPKEKMISFLIDLHIAEARINDLNLRRDSAEKLFQVVEDSLFIKNGIENDTVYDNSYEYYLADIEGLDEIYSAVVDSLSLRERLSKEVEAKKDSVNAKKDEDKKKKQAKDEMDTVAIKKGDEKEKRKEEDK